jgi:hypothetical protein
MEVSVIFLVAVNAVNSSKRAKERKPTQYSVRLFPPPSETENTSFLTKNQNRTYLSIRIAS